MKTEIAQTDKARLNTLIKKLDEDELRAVTKFTEFIISTREKSSEEGFVKLMNVLNRAPETATEISNEEKKELDKESRKSKKLLEQGKLSTLESLRRKNAV